jgi:hypothetical protein
VTNLGEEFLNKNFKRREENHNFPPFGKKLEILKE